MTSVGFDYFWPDRSLPHYQRFLRFSHSEFTPIQSRFHSSCSPRRTLFSNHPAFVDVEDRCTACIARGDVLFRGGKERLRLILKVIKQYLNSLSIKLGIYVID